MRQIAVGVNSAPDTPTKTKLLPIALRGEGYCPFSQAVPFHDRAPYSQCIHEQPIHEDVTMTLSIGTPAPDFEAESTEGHISFHKWLGDSWGLFF